MTHKERVDCVFSSIESGVTVDSLIETLESYGEIWDVDDGDDDTLNKINLRKTAKFIKMVISAKGYEKAKKAIYEPIHNVGGDKK